MTGARRTDLVFINRSLNTNVRSVGLYWDMPEPLDVLCWYRIRECGFLWWHPLRIRWAWGAVRCDRFGNRRTLACGFSQQGTAPAVIEIPPMPKDPDALALLLTCDGRPVARLPAPWDEGCTVKLPQSLVFCADLPCSPEEVVHPDRIGPGAQAFPLSGLAKASIAMIGGAPGPRSTPIGFHDGKPPARK